MTSENLRDGPTPSVNGNHSSGGSTRRRHSLPPANKLASMIHFWTNSSEDNLHRPATSGERLSRTHSQNSHKSGKSGSRGRRQSKSSQPPAATQPVLVRAYSPRPESRIADAIAEADETERVELPPIEAFSFDNILRAIDPKGNIFPVNPLYSRDKALLLI